MFKTVIRLILATVALSLSATALAQAQSATLLQVQERGYLRCGVNPGQLGMSMANAQGEWIGISTDLCRAVAAATLGDADAVEFVPVTAGNRFSALMSGRIDLIARNTTWTFTRDATEGVQFVGPYFVDVETVLTRRDGSIATLSQLDEASVCVIAGSPSEVIMRDLSASAGARINIIPTGSAELYREAYLEERCSAIADGRAALQSMRVALPEPDAHIFVGDPLAFSPLSLGVREGDDPWGDIVRWVFFALVTAEEYGVTAETVIDVSESTTIPTLVRMLQPRPGSGARLGLEDDWARRAIRARGNLAEIYERNFGEDSSFTIDRGPSALWRDGGMIAAPPF